MRSCNCKSHHAPHLRVLISKRGISFYSRDAVAVRDVYEWFADDENIPGEFSMDRGVARLKVDRRVAHELLRQFTDAVVAGRFLFTYSVEVSQ